MTDKVVLLHSVHSDYVDFSEDSQAVQIESKIGDRLSLVNSMHDFCSWVTEAYILQSNKAFIVASSSLAVVLPAFYVTSLCQMFDFFLPLNETMSLVAFFTVLSSPEDVSFLCQSENNTLSFRYMKTLLFYATHFLSESMETR